MGNFKSVKILFMNEIIINSFKMEPLKKPCFLSNFIFLERCT